MTAVNSQFLVNMLIIALGYIAKRLNLLTEKDGKGISSIILNFTLPALVINTFSNITLDYSLILLPVIYIVFGTVMTLFALVLFRKYDRNVRGMLSIFFPGCNIGLFAYPFVEAIWGADGLKYLAMIDIGNAIMLFGVCYVVGCYFSPNEAAVDYKVIIYRLLRNIPLMVYIGALILKIADFHLPQYVTDVTGALSKANMPLSLMLLGLYLSFNFDKSYIRNMFKVLGMRYSISIAAGVLLYFILPFEPLFKNTVLLVLLLPMGMSVIPYSVQFGYDQKFVGIAANIANIISFALMWILFAVTAAI